jgi:hypothetical protein
MRVENIFLDDQLRQFGRDGRNIRNVERLFRIDVAGSPDLITFGPVKTLNLFTSRII